MRITMTVIAITTLLFQASAQFEPFISLQQDSTIQVQAYGTFSIMSDQIPLSFTTAFFTGNRLSIEDRENALRKMKPRNQFSLISEYGVSVRKNSNCIKDTLQCSGLFGGISHHTMIFASLPSDAAKLILMGNSEFVGKTAYLDDFKLSYHQFTKLYLGAVRSFGKNNDHCFSMSPFISFHQPPVELNIRKGRVKTASDTSMVSVLINGELHLGLPHETITQSIGGGIDFKYASSALIKDHILIFSVENLGVFRYSGSSYTLKNDSNFVFSGIHFTNLNHIDSTLSALSDSIGNQTGLTHDTLGLTMLLPLRLKIEIINIQSERFGLSGSITSYPFHQRSPVFECIAEYGFSRYWKAGIPLAIGEAAGLGAGFFIEYQSRSLYFSLLARSGHSFSSSFSQTGFAAFARVAYRF